MKKCHQFVYVDSIASEARRFNVMVVGESGLGKTTFLHTLLRRYVSVYFQDPVKFLQKTVEIVEVGEFLIMDVTTRPAVEVHLYDTPGYGDFINNQGTINKIYKDIYDRHILRNSMVPRDFASEADWNSQDTRIHCLFYFIPSHRMKDIDEQFIEMLSPIVPIVPIIAKADMMTVDERNTYVQEVHSKLNELSTKLGKSCIFEFQYNDFPHFYVHPMANHEFNAVSSRAANTTENYPGNTDGNSHENTTENIAECNNNLRDQVIAQNHSVPATLKSTENDLRIQEEVAGSMVTNVNDSLELNSRLTTTNTSATTHSVAEPVSPQHQNRSMADSASLGIKQAFVYEQYLQSMNSDRMCYPPLEISPMEVDDNTVIKQYENIFAVVCALTDERVYPWGTLKIDDMTHSDFRLLQTLLFEKGQNIKRFFDKTHEMSNFIANGHIILERNVESTMAVEDTVGTKIFAGLNYFVQTYLNGNFLFNLVLLICLLYYSVNFILLIKL